MNIIARRTLLLISFGTGITLAVFFGALNTRNYWRLSISGIPTQATIVDVDTTSGDTRYKYVYAVGSANYARWDIPSGLEISLRKGDSATIYYLSSDPYISCLGKPGEHVRDDLIVLVIIAFVLPAFIFLYFSRRLKRPIGA